MWKGSTLWHAIPARISETAAVAGASPRPTFFNILPAKFQFVGLLYYLYIIAQPGINSKKNPGNNEWEAAKPLPI